MLLSTQTHTLGYRLSEEQSVRILCETGYDALDYSMFFMHDAENVLNRDGYKDYVLNLKKIASDYGVPFNQAHTPFPSCKENDPDYNKITFTRLVRSLEIAGLLGVRNIIVHPVSIADKDRQKDYNIDLYNRLRPYCEEYGVKVALENMWGWNAAEKRIVPNVCSLAAELADYIDALDSRFFTVCLDIGHCGLVGENASDAIRILGGMRLTALHVHDNDNFQDSHTIPYLGKIDWKGVAQALSDIGYTGELTLEADNFMASFPDEMLPTAAKFMHDTGRQLIHMVEGKL
ncbi:MAG: sugar phosphate isomerase/epimerase family protein [Eubacteriales bacterium]